MNMFFLGVFFKAYFSIFRHWYRYSTTNNNNNKQASRNTVWTLEQYFDSNWQRRNSYIVVRQVEFFLHNLTGF